MSTTHYHHHHNITTTIITTTTPSPFPTYDYVVKLFSHNVRRISTIRHNKRMNGTAIRLRCVASYGNTHFSQAACVSNSKPHSRSSVGGSHKHLMAQNIKTSYLNLVQYKLKAASLGETLMGSDKFILFQYYYIIIISK